VGMRERLRDGGRRLRGKLVRGMYGNTSDDGVLNLSQLVLVRFLLCRK